MFWVLLLFARCDEDDTLESGYIKWIRRFEDTRKDIYKLLNAIKNSLFGELVENARVHLIEWRQNYLPKHAKLWKDHKTLVEMTRRKWRNEKEELKKEKQNQKNIEVEIPGEKDHGDPHKQYIPEM